MPKTMQKQLCLRDMMQTQPYLEIYIYIYRLEKWFSANCTTNRIISFSSSFHAFLFLFALLPSVYLFAIVQCNFIAAPYTCTASKYCVDYMFIICSVFSPNGNSLFHSDPDYFFILVFLFIPFSFALHSLELHHFKFQYDSRSQSNACQFNTK